MDAKLLEIVSSGKTCYFISPHYDDAVFSASSLASYLKKYSRIVVINIFTKAGPRPYTLSAKAYLRQCNYADAAKLYQDRTKEDKDALSGLADQVVDLDFTEALWRSRPGKVSRLLNKLLPELGKIYPTYRFHIAKGKIARADAHTLESIKRDLKNVITEANSIIFCPLAIGGHVDHVITRQVCDELFPDPIHWADYPYNVNDQNDVNTAGMQSFTYVGDPLKKQRLIAKYSTQYDAMFSDGVTQKPETYYTA